MSKLSIPLSRIQNLAPVIILVVIAVSVIIGGRGYQVGSLTSMGPGFMPVACGTLLLLLALVLLWSEWRTQSNTELTLSALRPLLCASASILLWALLSESLGFIIAGMAQLMLAYLAVPQNNWKLVALSAVFITTLTFGLFVMLLGIPLKAFV